jgi:4-hydroxy-tetrahydrodipicolinate reductase
MTLTHLALVGATGRMGKAIYQLCSDQNIALTHAIARYHAGTDLGTVWQQHPLDLLVTAEPPIADKAWEATQGIIDFATIDNFDQRLDWYMAAQKPVVIGTTGLSEAHQDRLHILAQKVPVLWSANMSLGVMALQQSLQTMAHLFNDAEVYERHHKHKKDSPSGTALMLGKALENAGFDNITYHATRHGTCAGTHRIVLTRDHETLTLEHVAENRTIFAKGALEALKWLINKPAGFLYNLTHMV